MAISYNPHPNESCPWHPYAEKFGYPDVKWCEETLCAWISEPANTWSNISYIIVAVLTWIIVHNKKRPDLIGAPITLLVAGLCSFLWHASNFFYTQILDFAGAFSFPAFLIIFNLRRIGISSSLKRWSTFTLIILFHIVLMVVFYKNNIGVRLSAVPLITLLLLTELKAFKRGYHYRNLGLAIILGFIGIIFVNLDHTELLCNPQNHYLQGHALWHILTAIAGYFAFQHYLQFSVNEN